MQTPSQQPSVKIVKTHKAFIFGGAYGNLQATQAILERARRHGFRSDEIVFTGDSVAYCANPLETAELIRSSGIHALMGNCEEALATGAMDCGCGFEEGTACDALSQEWFNFCRNNITDDVANWMGSLPRNIELHMGDFKLLCTHATPGSINQFVFASDMENGQFVLGNDPYDGYVTGHSGLPYLTEIKGKSWTNSGSGGMPANDGTARVWYATLTLEADTLHAETHALDYDHRAAHRAMMDAGLDNGYAQGLVSGLWPSLDVLPIREANETGTALQPEKRAFRRMPQFS